jgi:hypothetical protein
MGTSETPAEPPTSAAAVPEDVATDAASPSEPALDLPEQPLRLSAQSAPLEQNSSGRTEQVGLEIEQKATPNASRDSVAPQQVVRRHGSAKPTL